MKKKVYVIPQIACFQLNTNRQLLAGSDINTLSVDDVEIEIAGDDSEGLYGN